MKTLSELAKSRITIISGPYGAGKTNIAVNLALSLAAQGRECRLADLDIVNPYFRSADNRVLLEGSGVETLIPEFANTNVDIPALPANYNRLFTGTGHSVADVGGDPDGAAVLGLSHDEYIAAGYTMYFVYNRYRPLTALPEDALAMLRDIERVSGLRFDGIINNSNLGAETDAAAVLSSAEHARRFADSAGLPLVATTACIETGDTAVIRISNITKQLF